jgi:hypothetical protein
MLFLASAGFVLWQNTRVAVLWDLGYLLDTSWRMALGQMPYRDFPLAHAPLTFAIQAVLMRIAGRHYMMSVLYAAVASGIGTLIAWRIALHTLRGAWQGGAAWIVSLLLAAPLVVVGVYAIYPHPIYDCDCALAMLLALWLLTRAEDACGWATPFCAGVATVLPVFFKQNMGLPFVAAVAGALCLPQVAEVWRKRGLPAEAQNGPSTSTALLRKYAFVLAGIGTALCAGSALIATTAGLGNYFHWTVQFAAQRRMPGLGAMLQTYRQPSLVWTLPALGIGLLLCHTRWIARVWWKLAAFCLIAAPFAGSLLYLLLQDDADERADNLLELWPLCLLVVAVAALFALRRGITLGRMMPFIVLAAIHGTFLSQQLWGSTYALWPLLLILLAWLVAAFPVPARSVATGFACVICATFLVCGGLYAVSLERLSYIDIPDEPIEHSTLPALQTMADRGLYLRNLDKLAAFAAWEIPQQDALILLPGEDPFYFATGRTPQFPVTLFDPATDPYAPAELMDEARRRGVRWVIVKRVQQIKADPLPGREQTLQLIEREFGLYRRLNGYDVYRRR